MMRARWSVVVVVGAVTWSCGDGVGRPIVGEGITVTGAGRSGAGSGDAGGPGGAGAGGGSAAGVGGVSMTSGAAGGAGVSSGGAGTAGSFGGSDAGMGGRERMPPDGGGLRPPFEESGGTAGDGPGGGGRSGLPPLPGGTPDEEHCAPVSSWDENLDRSEFDLFNAVNFIRSQGIACATTPGGPPPPPEEPVPTLDFNPALRCAARLHSRDMSENQYLGHVNGALVGPEDRMRQAGAVFRVAGETVAEIELPPGESMDPFIVVSAILSEGGSECANLKDPSFTWVGIGVYWDRVTLDFSGP
jgi:uncharacterized protein YkwD